MKAGRNDPCQCGSGKKYKRCCLVERADADLMWHRLRRAEGTVVGEVLAFAKRNYGPDVIAYAWEEFSRGANGAGDEDPLFETAFIPWFVFNWAPEPALARTPTPPVNAPLALQYLASRACRLDVFDQRFARATCDRPYSFYTVTAVEPGQSITLADILTSCTYCVRERSASAMVRTGAVLYTRILSMDGVAIMSGCAPLLIPPDFRLRLLDLRDSLAKAVGRITEDHLHGIAAELREVYFDIADELYHPPLPKLCNTDGDPLVPTTLHFELRCTPQQAFDALQTLALEGTAAAAMEDASFDAAGALRAVRFNWSKRGNRLHKTWDNTTLGSLHIDGARLTVHANSERRAETIRAEVERRLGERVVFKRAVGESIERALEERRDRPETAKERRRREAEKRVNALPEVQEELRAMAAAHWQSWLDENLPALANRTPRQASRSPEGRERLEALLQQFEWSAERAPAMAFNPDVAALRRQLGLSP